MICKNKIIRNLLLASAALSLIAPVCLIASEPTYGNSNKQPNSGWQTVFSAMRRRRQRPVSRPLEIGSICFISPVNQGLVYSNRPFFVWKGNLKKIAVTNFGSDDLLWQNEIKGKNSFVSYTGKVNLLPGESYEWRGFIGENPAVLADFQMMDKQQRQVVTNDLKSLEIRLNKKGSNKQVMALEKAKYFVNKELWSDALQEAYSIPNPPAELSQLLRDFPNQMCS